MSFQIAHKLFSRFLFVGVVISFCVTGCSISPNTKKAFPLITDVFISPFSGFNVGDLREYELTPDGNLLYNFSGQLVDIRTGDLQSEFGFFGMPMHLSPDGRYMADAYSVPVNSEDTNLIKTNLFVHDLNTNTLLDGLSEGLAPISWAPDSSYILMGDFKTIISVPDMQTNTAWNHTVNFREIDSIAGYQNILWDRDQNIPIAIISGCGFNCLTGKSDNPTQKVDWSLIPISGVTNRQENTDIENFFSLSLPDAVVDWSFDPSGQYVVFAIWNQSAMPLEFDQTISKNVLDSTLVLVDWRTKESIELLKLSEVDPQNFVIQWGGGLRWSSDGSTLLVPREGAEALVLKLKYPSTTNMVIDEPTSTPEEIAMQTPAPLLENVEPTPDFLLSCENINEHGIPSASTNIQKSHILFMANNIDTSLNEFWVISLKNGARKQISKPEILSTDFYFLDDGYHFIMNQHNGMVAIGDIDDNAVEYVDINDSILEKLPPYSILWQRFQEGNQNFTNSPIGAYSRGEVYSPDGRKFASYSLGDDALYIIDVESQNKIPVIYTPVDEFGRAATISGQWTKNSEQFIFSRTWKEPDDDAIYSQLYSVDRNGENLRQLIDPLTNKWINSIQISPNQEKIVMGIMQLDDLHREMFGILNLVTDEFQMFATGSPTRHQMHKGSFTWSPDSRYLAYITHWNQIDIRIIDIYTGKYYCLTNNDAIETALYWK